MWVYVCMDTRVHNVVTYEIVNFRGYAHQYAVWSEGSNIYICMYVCMYVG